MKDNRGLNKAVLGNFAVDTIEEHATWIRVEGEMGDGETEGGLTCIRYLG